MRTESRVTGAGPHPGGPARWAQRGMRPHPGSMALRPAGRMPVQQLDSEDRRPDIGGPGRGTPPRCGVAGRPPGARLGWDPRAQLRSLRDVDCGPVRTPYRQQPLGQFAGPCHRVRPSDPRWEATQRAAHVGIAGLPRAPGRPGTDTATKGCVLPAGSRLGTPRPLTLTRSAPFTLTWWPGLPGALPHLAQHDPSLIHPNGRGPRKLTMSDTVFRDHSNF
jgi:hypothetical protein